MDRCECHECVNKRFQMSGMEYKPDLGKKVCMECKGDGLVPCPSCRVTNGNIHMVACPFCKTKAAKS